MAHGSLPNSDAGPESVCLLRLSAIGDCCHAVPVVRTLQRAWPRTRITWIIGRTEAALFGDLDGVECITFDKGAGWAGYHRLRRQLRGRRFDRLLLMQVALRAALLSTAVRAPLRLGFDRARSRDGHGLFINQRIAEHPRRHVMDGFFDFAAAMGVHQRQLRWNIPIPEQAQASAREHIPDECPTLVISPCSSQRWRNFRNWPEAHYARVADHAAGNHGMRVIVTGGPSAIEHHYGEAIQRLARAPVINLVGRTGLKELLALLGRAAAVLCPDSGPAHMAVAAGTPVLGLYATSNPDRTGPYLGRRWVINAYPEAVRRAFGCDVDALPWGRRVRQADAMSLISPDAVMTRVDALMATPPDERLA